MRRPPRERFVLWATPLGISGSCLVIATVAYGSPVGRALLFATAASSLLMRWSAARYATAVLITAAWLGRAVSAFWEINGYDDRTNLTVALLWPCLWAIAASALLSVHQTYVRERALGI